METEESKQKRIDLAEILQTEGNRRFMWNAEDAPVGLEAAGGEEDRSRDRMLSCGGLAVSDIAIGVLSRHALIDEPSKASNTADVKAGIKRHPQAALNKSALEVSQGSSDSVEVPLEEEEPAATPKGGKQRRAVRRTWLHW
eukprot:gene6485-7775_t